MTAQDTVLFVAGDPGGAAALLPVIESWSGHKIVLGYRQAGTMFREAGLEIRALDEGHASSDAAADWIGKTQAALVVAGTSVNGVDWDRHFVVAARECRIPSVSVLDYWSNYTPRFTFSTSLDALPDAIAIMDERARAEMIAEGFPADRLVVTGQPVFDEVLRWRAGITTGDRPRFREQLGLSPQERAFLFVSQPLREMRLATGGDPGTEVDEFAALEKLAGALTAMPSSAKVLLVKLHPRENADKFNSVLASLAFPARVVARNLHRWEVCMGADLIFGINSMLLEEALLMGCPIQRIGVGAGIDLNFDPQTRSNAEMPGGRVSLATTRITQLIVSRLQSQQRST